MNIVNSIALIKHNLWVRLFYTWDPFLLVGVIKIKVHTRGSMCTTSIEAHLFHKRIEDLRSKVNPRSRPADKLVTQLREEGIEILSSQLDRQTVVVWTWCRTQAALEHVQKLYETNQLREIFFEIIQTSISTVIDVDKNQFEKTVGKCLWI